MLVASSGGGGAVNLEHLIRVYRISNPPYLRRNVRRAVKHLTMGSAASALVSPRRQPPFEDAESDEDQDVRPAKRRRIRRFDEDEALPESLQSTQRQPFGQVTNGRNLKSVKPAEFYGKARLSALAAKPAKLSRYKSPMKRPPSKIICEKILPKDPHVFRPALRVELYGIGPNSHTDLWLPSAGELEKIDIKCRCTIAVFYRDSDPTETVQDRTYVEVCRKVQAGILRVTFRGDQAVRELMFSEPHIFLSHEIMVNRKQRSTSKSQHKGNEEFQHSFGLAEDYTLQIVLEPLGRQKEWPTLHISSTSGDLSNPQRAPGEISRNDWQLSTAAKPLHEVGGRRKQPLKAVHKKLSIPTSYCLQMDVKWSIPNQLTAAILPYRPMRLEPPIAVQPSTPKSPERETAEASDILESPGGRAQRRRNNVSTYNLKTLSAQAQGKSPRTRKVQDILSEEIHSEKLSFNEDNLTVTYAFGRADAAEHTIKQQTLVQSLTCPFCMLKHLRLDDLRLHLRTDHSNFKFSLRRANETRVTFFVEFVGCPSTTGVNDKSRTVQLNKPMTLFDLEKYLNGDESWIKAREGPVHNIWLKAEHHQSLFPPIESASSASPGESRHSSPNTSHGPDEMDLDRAEPVLSKPARQGKSFLVPNTVKPLYDSVTKRILQPGEEIPIDDKDEDWLHQRHRDVIMDYDDVTDDEKDYVIQWNAFIMEEYLTCEKFLPEACIKFAEINAKEGWFNGKKSRKREFGLHLETFVMRGVIDEGCLKKCVQILKKATQEQEAQRDGDTDMEEVDFRNEPPERLRGVLDCVCSEFTQPPDRVVCKGVKCPGRFFHRECASKQGRPITGPWKCDACIS